MEQETYNRSAEESEDVRSADGGRTRRVNEAIAATQGLKPDRSNLAVERERRNRAHLKAVLGHMLAQLETGTALHREDRDALVKATIGAAGPIPPRMRTEFERVATTAIDQVALGNRGIADQYVREQAIALGDALPPTFVMPQPDVEMDPRKLAEEIARG